MKTCAYCGHESEDSAPACVGCGEPLSPIPAADDSALGDSGEELVVLARCRTVVEANMLRLRLESAGIECCVPEELNPQILWYLVPSPIEDVSVRVRRRDLDAAREALADPDVAPQPAPPPASPS